MTSRKAKSPAPAPANAAAAVPDVAGDPLRKGDLVNVPCVVTAVAGQRTLFVQPARQFNGLVVTEWRVDRAQVERRKESAEVPS